MREFRFCVALRHDDGSVDGSAHEEVITARDAADAVALAKAIDVDMVGLKANTILLVDPNGNVVWSLRVADMPPDTGIPPDLPLP